MADVSALVDEIKRLAVSAVDAGKPCGVFFGTVKSASPLEISIEQKLTLSGRQLILARAVTDYDAQVETDGTKKEIKVRNALKVGERVALLRLEGGQRFLVADRVGD